MSKRASSWLVAAWILVAAVAPAPAAEQVAVGRVSVVDGDTLELHGQRIRLTAIDAPEARQTCLLAAQPWPCGRRAAFALADRIGGQLVACRWWQRDLYRRPVAACEVAGTDLGGWLVETGWALAYRRYGQGYVVQENLARAARRGLWAGSFAPPWAWRRGNHRTVSARSYLGA